MRQPVAPDCGDPRSEILMPQAYSCGSGMGADATMLASGNGLGLPGCQALSPVVGDGAINDRAAVDALPRVKNEKEIREPFQHHQPFALRTFHRSLPVGYVHSWWRTQARAAPICRISIFQ